MSDNDTPNLEDLGLRIIRAKNDAVDEELTSLEEQIDELESKVADYESQVSDLEEENEQYEQLVSQIREGERQKQLDRIREANAVVDEDDEVDLSSFEQAEVDTLEAVADQMERLAEAAEEAANAGVSNNGSQPDVGGSDPADVDGQLPNIKEFAEQEGLGSAYERVIEKGDVRTPNGVESDGGDLTPQDIANALNGGD